MLYCSGLTSCKNVALLVSAWIEIENSGAIFKSRGSRTPRECVDWNAKIRTEKQDNSCRTPRECVDWNLKDILVNKKLLTSHSSWVRGLKCRIAQDFPPPLASHSSWVRGLKYYMFYRISQAYSRTPRECVDWNMIQEVRWMKSLQSHSSWVRGLKCRIAQDFPPPLASHSSWVRGLKFVSINQRLHYRASHSSWVRGLK